MNFDLEQAKEAQAPLRSIWLWLLSISC
jgi:hypothetical protein